MKKYPRYSLGKPINSYVQYKSMVQRCTYKGKLRTDYAGNNLTPEWLNYDNWMDWANNQKGFLNLEANGRIWSLDKDILKKGNKHYCPDLCVFVPNALNQFFKIQESSRSDLPLGVYTQDGVNYKVRVNNGKGQHIYLGQYLDPNEAHEVYLTGKTNLGKELADKYADLVDERVLEVVSDFRKWFLS